jgi:hypothetical protein
MPGIGAGTTAAPCAIVNAIANALPAEAAAAIQMPVTAAGGVARAASQRSDGYLRLWREPA